MCSVGPHDVDITAS